MPKQDATLILMQNRNNKYIKIFKKHRYFENTISIILCAEKNIFNIRFISHYFNYIIILYAKLFYTKLMEFLSHVVIVITLAFFSILFLITQNAIQSKNYSAGCIVVVPLFSILSEMMAQLIEILLKYGVFKPYLGIKLWSSFNLYAQLLFAESAYLLVYC